MSLSQQRTGSAPETVGAARRPVLHLVRTRLRQLRRVVVGLAAGLALAAAACAVYWLTCLWGLPDIGDPFDVAAFRAFHVPEDRDAFAFLRRAQQAMTPFPALSPATQAAGPGVAWSQADPRLREWAAANRQSLALLLQGADQADGDAHPGGELSGHVDPMRLTWLALLEGCRREESGDTSGAWDCYRAVIRMTTHIRRRGHSAERFWVNRELGWLERRLAAWAASTNTSTRQVRRALDELLENAPRPEWDANFLKLKYLEMMSSLDQPVHPFTRQDLEGEYSYRLGDMQVPASVAAAYYDARRALRREPERSRRVVRLLCANWLAHIETPGVQPSQPAVRASFEVLVASNPRLVSKVVVPVYAVGREAPAEARSLSPRELARWLVSTDDAKRLLDGGSWHSDRLQDRRVHSELVFTVAKALYRRERGAPPATDDDLVGAVLPHLPDDGSAELDDGTAPTIADSAGETRPPSRP